MKNTLKLLFLISIMAIAQAGSWFPEQKEIIRTFSDTQIEAFLDSVGSLPLEPLLQKSSEIPDSIFKSRTQLNQKLSFINFYRLKHAAKKGNIDLSFAKSLFNDLEIDSSQIQQNKISLNLYSFNHFKEFAISVGNPEYSYECDLYFFKSRSLIAKHHIRHRYGLQIKHYQDESGKIVIYYKENFISGSGICWYNYYFYQFSGHKLIPILNMLETSNLSFPWGNRIICFGTEIINTNPLLLKMEYSVDFCIPYPNQNFVSDIDTIPFYWDNNDQKLVPDFSKSSLNEKRIISFYLINNEALFINLYYEELKACLNNIQTRESLLNYLDAEK